MESKRKHGFLKAALPAFAMLLVAVLSLTTVTFAWFTQGDSATVDTFELDVSAGGGLEISTTDGKTAVWKSKLTTADLTDETNGIQAIKDFAHSTGTSDLAPVSTIGEIADGKIKFFEATIDETDNHQITSISEASESAVLSFELFFRNSSADAKDITIKGTEFGKVDTFSAELATRLAFVDSGSHNVSADGLTYTDSAVTMGKAKIFEPNKTTHTQDGIKDYETVGGHAGTSEKADIPFEYLGIKAKTEGPTEAFGRYDSSKSEYLAEVNPTADTETFFTLNANSVTKITVYIWIEGQDADCTNFISSNAFSAHLKFSVKGA